MVSGLLKLKLFKNLEDSFRQNKPRALIQMATGAGKTYTAASFIYRLLKFSKANRILFLVDTKKSWRASRAEFMKFVFGMITENFTELLQCPTT